MKHNLDRLFNPASIAVIGASDKPHAVGAKVFKNLLQGNYVGKLYAINPKHKEILGQPCFASIKEIKESVELVVITTPASTVAKIMTECGEHGVRAAVVISAGFSEMGEQGKALENSVLEITQRYKIRWIGPNCLGIMRSSLNLNASFDNNTALPGHIALISQSGALCAAILDWAVNKQIGFSTMVSLGNSADVDFGEVLDYLAHDTKTKSILLYIEGIHNSQSFMNGLCAAAKIKPVIAIKAGKNSQGSRAAHSHTGALVGNDDVFDAALRRCGAVRVMSIEQLFSAAEVLSSNYRVKGNRLAVITNGGGAGVMTADRASELKVNLPALNESTITQLNKVLPAQWSHQNPIDIIGDAGPERYHTALDICAQDDNIDALLAILVPVAMVEPIKVAEQIIADKKQNAKPILTCWMGEKQVKSSWSLFNEHNIPSFNTPEKAIEAFSYLANYHDNQQFLLQANEAVLSQPTSDTKAANLIIEKALAENRTLLTTLESKNILQAFAIPVSQAVSVHTADEAEKAAEDLNYPVVMKINSPDITHKQDVGGVQLNLGNAEAVRSAFDRIIANAKRLRPDAKITGVTVERMYKNPNDRELMIGVAHDKVFGSAISFGMGGSLVEVIKDSAVALPPLNQFIAKQLIARTRIAKALGEFRNMAAVDLDKIVDVLLHVSNMLIELPQILEMDINPLIANDKEVIAVDARVVVTPAKTE